MEDIADIESFGAFDMQDLLTDPFLQAELRALGWQEGAPLREEQSNVEEDGKKNQVIQTKVHDTSLTNLIDVHALIGPEELQVTFEESDLNDPELLKAYEELLPDSKNSIITQPKSVSTTVLASSTLKVSATPASNELEGVSAAEAKRRACQLKREGNTDEALKWFRYAKQLDSQAHLVSQAKTEQQRSTVSSLPVKTLPTVMSPFLALEDAIKQASDLSLSAAKSLRDIDSKGAVEEMREYKRLQQELKVLQSRQNIPGANPPLFHWESIKRQEKVEYLELGESDLKVSIKSLTGLESVLREHSSRTISINFCISQSLSKESTNSDCNGSTKQLSYELNKPLDINCESVLSCIKRGKLSQQTYARKKLQFEIVLHRGFFRSNLVVATTSFPFQPLLEACECEQDLPLYAAEVVDGNVKKGKAVGGSLKVALRVRTPISKPEIKVHEIRRLVIGSWPSIISNIPVSIPEQKEDSRTTVAPTMKLPYSDLLTEKEKMDPEDVEFVESNDVMESEIEKIQQMLQGHCSEDEQFSLTTKLQLLSVKMQILVTKVQNETLSIEEYLNILKERMKRDQMMALYQKAKGDSESLSVAVNLMRRIKIMQIEIKNAKDAGEPES